VQRPLPAKGIRPAAALKWDLPFLNYVQGQWIPAEKPAPPLVNYSGYAKPITREQLEKLAQPHQWAISGVAAPLTVGS